jgi:hypothetical protein
MSGMLLLDLSMVVQQQFFDTYFIYDGSDIKKSQVATIKQ